MVHHRCQHHRQCISTEEIDTDEACITGINDTGNAHIASVSDTVE
jgi:hypothetical protein